MDEDTATLAAAIGTRVRSYRQRRGWTLDQLSEQAGVSRRMLVNVEQGASNASIGTLLRLSDALGVGLPALVEHRSAASIQVVRASQGAALWTGPSGGRGVLVAGTQPPDVLELWDWTLNPGEAHTSEAHADGTHELLQVHEGGMVLTVDGVSETLHPGDGAGFAGDLPHGYANTSQHPVRFSLTVFEPGVGPGKIGGGESA